MHRAVSARWDPSGESSTCRCARGSCALEGGVRGNSFDFAAQSAAAPTHGGRRRVLRHRMRERGCVVFDAIWRSNGTVPSVHGAGQLRQKRR